MRRSGWILELDRGYGIPWEGNYSSWLEQKELEWVRQNPKGRQAKSKGSVQI